MHRNIGLKKIHFNSAMGAIVGSIMVIVVVILAIRFGFGGPEDSWICSNGAWVRHGNPSQPQPSTGCGQSDRRDDATTVSVFYGTLSPDSTMQSCSVVRPVERTISRQCLKYRAALEELFAGPTQDEIAQGFFSFFNETTKDILISVNVDEGVAYVNLVDIRSLIPNVSASCGSAQFLSEVTSTLTQFPEIKKVIFAIDGEPSTFYEWIQVGCSKETNECDPEPFVIKPI